MVESPVCCSHLHDCQGSVCMGVLRPRGAPMVSGEVCVCVCMFFAWLVWMSVGVALKWVCLTVDPPLPLGVTLPSWHGGVAVCPWCAMGGGPSLCMQPFTMLGACEVWARQPKAAQQRRRRHGRNVV